MNDDAPVPRARPSRDALLEAAAEEFAGRGLRGARIREIVQRAGVNERMLYHHFGSKEGLYRAVLESRWGGLAAGWAPALERAAALAPREGLELVFGAFARVLQRQPQVLHLVMHEAMNGWELAPRATIDQVPAVVRELFRRGVDDGTFRSDVPFEVFYLTLVGALTSELFFGGRFADLGGRSFVDDAVRLVFDGLVRARSSEEGT